MKLLIFGVKKKKKPKMKILEISGLSDNIINFFLKPSFLVSPIYSELRGA